MHCGFAPSRAWGAAADRDEKKQMKVRLFLGPAHLYVAIRLRRVEENLAKRYNSSFAAPSGFSFSAGVGQAARSAEVAEVKGGKTPTPSISERRHLSSGRRKSAA